MDNPVTLATLLAALFAVVAVLGQVIKALAAAITRKRNAEPAETPPSQDKKKISTSDLIIQSTILETIQETSDEMLRILREVDTQSAHVFPNEFNRLHDRLTAQLSLLGELKAQQDRWVRASENTERRVDQISQSLHQLHLFIAEAYGRNPPTRDLLPPGRNPWDSRG